MVFSIFFMGVGLTRNLGYPRCLLLIQGNSHDQMGSGRDQSQTAEGYRAHGSQSKDCSQDIG
jgi:hypothetical protein